MHLVLRLTPRGGAPREQVEHDAPEICSDESRWVLALPCVLAFWRFGVFQLPPRFKCRSDMLSPNMVLAPCSLAPAETATVLRLSQFSSPTRFSRAAPRLPAPRPARSVLLPHKKPQQDKPAEQAGNAAQGGRRGTRWQIHARAAPSKRADPRELDVARSKSTTPPKDQQQANQEPLAAYV